MTAQIIDGKALASQLRTEIKQRTQSLIERGLKPGLAVILVGHDPASEVYVRNKVKACEEMGFDSRLIQFPADMTSQTLLEQIQQLNANPSVHGILVQLPLPSHINAQQVIESIAAEKDVDGFHIHNAGLLLIGQPLFRPCTPYGVMKMLESIEYPIRGAHAVIVGASNIVGKPQALLLLQAGATITICNSKTRDLASHTRQADILVVAAGKPALIKADMVKPGAVVIDVGIHRGENGKLMGDVDFASVREKAAYITPVPGGVGPMTITMLLMNTLEAAERTVSTLKP